MQNKQLGHYEITERVGAGGMGEVYRARDTKLGRDVALKVLPPIFAQDPERLARFKREAKVLASLNHAHIATLHGLEEDSGQHFLVMEMVEGDDLAERLAKGSIRITEALKIVRDVADALQAAHGQGIVHRDLKPANVKVTPEGKVKVLDFGLAKAFESDPTSPDITQSPTIATAMGTAGGVILGTAAYMSPEQARGKPVDKLTDVWALGCLLFEMLSGAHAFPGETVSDTIAKILEREPDWSQVPTDTPPPVQRLLRRCLEKEKSVRLQDVGEVRIEIDAALSGTSQMWSGPVSVAEPASSRQPARSVVGWIVGVLGFATALVFAALYFTSSTEPNRVLRSSIPRPTGTRFVSMGDYAGPVVVSPDGRSIAFCANDADLNSMLWVRDLSDLEARMLPGTDEAAFPFWSPDGRSLGFFTDTKLMRVELSGGLPITLCDAPNGRGGTWGSTGTILFSADFQVGLALIHASGGTPQPVTEVDSLMHSTHRWPEFMPDGEHFMFMAAHHDVSYAREYGVYFASLSDPQPRRVLDTTTGAIFASGHLLYVRENTLMAVPFDPIAGEKTGDPVTLIDKVQSDPTTWRSSFSASQEGLLAYHGSSVDLPATRLALVDRDGVETEAVEDAKVYYHLKLSPDGRKVACTSGTRLSNAVGLDIWVYDLDRGLRTRLSFGTGADVSPMWSPDGTQMAYTTVYPGQSSRESVMTLAQADGGGERVLLRDAEEDMWITDWSRDGRYIVYSRGGFVTQRSEIWVLPLVGNREPFPVLVTEFDDDVGSISPDGRWMAYATQEDLGNKIYVVPFVPPVEAGGDPNDTRAFSKWQVSADGDVGSLPLWNPNGGELFFIKADGTIWSASVETAGDGFRSGHVELVCKTDPWNFGRIGYDVTPDGNHFIVNSFSAAAAPPITLVQNWLLELER